MTGVAFLGFAVRWVRSWEGVLALYEYLDIKESEVGNLGSEIELTNGSLRTPSL